MTDDKEVSKMRLNELQYLLQPHTSAYKKFIKRVMNYKKYWLPYKFKEVYTGGNHSYNRTAAILKQLSEPVPIKEDKTKSKSHFSRNENTTADSSIIEG
jgi:hypothetical protein